MKSSVTLEVLFLILTFLPGCKKEPFREDMPLNLNVMTFNVRYDNPADNENNWKFRKEFAAATIQKLDIDVFGTQEVLYN